MVAGILDGAAGESRGDRCEASGTKDATSSAEEEALTSAINFELIVIIVGRLVSTRGQGEEFRSSVVVVGIRKCASACHRRAFAVEVRSIGASGIEAIILQTPIVSPDTAARTTGTVDIPARGSGAAGTGASHPGAGGSAKTPQAAST